MIEEILSSIYHFREFAASNLTIRLIKKCTSNKIQSKID